MTAHERQELNHQILRCMGHDRLASRGDELYKQAEREYTAQQLGRLHWLMRERENELYWQDAEAGAY